MKRKKFLAVMMVAAMALTLGACSQEKTESTAKDSTAANETQTAKGESGEESADTAAKDTGTEATKISFLTSQGKFKEEYRTMAEAIKQDHGIEVDFQVVPDNEYYSLLKVKLSTSEVPDIFEYNTPTNNVEIGAAEYCEDLSNEEWVSRLVNPEILKDINDGKIYALPKESSSGFLAVYYNADVLEKFGFKDPQPKTYQEFVDMLNTIKEKGDGVIPLYMTNKDTWTTQINMTAGFPVALDQKATETFEKLTKNELKWTDVPEFKDVLDKYNDLFVNEYVNTDFLSASYDTAAEKIATGAAAMYLSTEGFASDISAKYPDCKLGSFIIPYNDVEKMAIGAYVQGLFVPKAGKQVDKVKEFLKIWSDPKYQNLYYESQPGFPAYKDVEGGTVPESVQKLVDNYVTTKNYVYQLNDQMSQCSTVWPDLWTYYNEMISGTKTSDEVLETWQKQYVDFMQQQGAQGF